MLHLNVFHGRNKDHENIVKIMLTVRIPRKAYLSNDYTIEYFFLNQLIY